MNSNIYKTLPALLVTFVLILASVLPESVAQALTIAVDSHMPQVFSDGHSGAFVVLRDYHGSWQVIVSHVDSSANVTWDKSIDIGYDGGFITSAYDQKDSIIIVGDGLSFAGQGVYAQKIDFTGNMAWGSKPTLVSKHMSVLSIVPDNRGGAIIFGKTLDDANLIYAQRLDTKGNIVWDAAGIQVSENSSTYSKVIGEPDGAGGAFITWHESRPTWRDEWGPGDGTYIQHLDNNGNSLLATRGIRIGRGNEELESLSVDKYGVIIALNDIGHILFKRLDNSGNIVWGNSTPVSLSIPNSAPFDVELLSDSSGGAFIVWRAMLDEKIKYPPNNLDVYLQRINKEGSFQWPVMKVYPKESYKDGLTVITDSSGGLIVSWVDIQYQDIQNLDVSVLAQRFDKNGKRLWNMDGISLGKMYPPIVRDFKMVSNGLGGAIIVREEGESLEPRLFSQLLQKTGSYSVPDNYVYPHGPRDTHGEVSIGLSKTASPFNTTAKTTWLWLIPVFVVLLIILVLAFVRRISTKRVS